jgi:cytochrome oxidase Cu insertion factor (SCO1/SenC/PrrC family)
MTHPSVELDSLVPRRGRAVRRRSLSLSFASLLVLVAFAVAPPLHLTRLLAGDMPLGPKDGSDLPATDLERIKPGEHAPDFTLEDQDGRAITLSSFQGRVPVVLVFYRGHW